MTGAVETTPYGPRRRTVVIGARESLTPDAAERLERQLTAELGSPVLIVAGAITVATL